MEKTKFEEMFPQDEQDVKDYFEIIFKRKGTGFTFLSRLYADALYESMKHMQDYYVLRLSGQTKKEIGEKTGAKWMRMNDMFYRLINHNILIRTDRGVYKPNFKIFQMKEDGTCDISLLPDEPEVIKITKLKDMGIKCSCCGTMINLDKAMYKGDDKYFCTLKCMMKGLNVTRSTVNQDDLDSVELNAEALLI